MTDPHPMTAAFRDAFRCHPAGVALLTADNNGTPVALTVSSLISVSSNPPIVAFSLSLASSAAQPLLDAETIVIHMLGFDDLHLAQLGSTSGADRFGPGVDWMRLPTGEPRYSRVGTWFRARIIGTLPVQGAAVVSAELLEGEVSAKTTGQALVYHDRKWHRLQSETAT